MLHRLNLSSKSYLSSSSPFNSIPCIRNVQKRYKHGRDFPRNIPRPPPPSGEPIFSTPTMTLHHSPAPSAPSYKSTPTSFLPESHPFVPTTSLHPVGTHLPPPLNTKRRREKAYHLSEEDLQTIRSLRHHPDPAQRKSRKEIAKMFGCSPFFVGMAAPLLKDEVKEVLKKKAEEREGWGVRKRFFRDVRQKRREEWSQAEE